ncbi:glycosyltransferase family 41 protein [Polynucleobacter sp. MWH-UH35A]|uniref:tetratricopeptide repeat protein n=1 Tax=Polynucleobacter sp. MWH-UH35A TaxID=1855619 RepID=UPI001BFCDF37|nr:glycosyltransferase family 41 protein [Polynucleobacter sp. MWH-UH35A]QWD59900.1 tetratricopeptide repeat protein [Polynucleobacter sp. MWH-UH35A]
MNPQLQLMLQQAIQAFQNGNLESADLSLRRVLQVDSKNLPALHILGLIKVSQSNYKEAADYLTRAARIHPNDASIQYNLAKALSDSGNDRDALMHHKKAVTLAPNNPEAWLSYGKTASNLGRHEDALVWYGNALRLEPDYAEAALNSGATLKELKRYEEAITFAERALAINPNLAEAWSNIGGALHELKRYDEAIAHYDKALGLRPDYHEAWANKAATLHKLKRYDEAIAHYDKALGLRPDYHKVWANKGVTLHELKRYDEAIAHYDKALGLRPDYHEAWLNKGLALNLLKKHSESAKCFQKALEFNVGDSYLLGQAHHQMMLGCDWTDYDKKINEIFHLVNQGRKGAEPFGFQGIASSEELLKKCAEIYSSDNFPMLGNLSKLSKYEHHKIRIGYLCGEFRNQATSILMTRVWELHDQSKFEIFAFDNGWDDGSDYRQRIACAFSNIFDVAGLTDLDVAKLIHHNEIDILVNLNGFFGLARQGVFSYKPAPIQVNYLGFPGTMGIKYMDYIIADKVVVPEDSKIHYVEKLAYLPNSYQANDDKRKISDRKFSRAELGLPEDSFVFACFNNNYKITPTIFDSWMRILSLVQGSVLWLLADNPAAKDNLIKEALARGIDSCRLVFAERLPISEHLARHDLADLFLDTLPYNAHTTCSDALWAGLPVLTLKGQTFPGRVSASLLSAVGLSELVTYTQDDYEVLAIELAKNPKKLANIKLKLINNRLIAPLFDAPLFTNNLESAYIKMYERYQAGLEPQDISIT